MVDQTTGALGGAGHQHFGDNFFQRSGFGFDGGSPLVVGQNHLLYIEQAGEFDSSETYAQLLVEETNLEDEWARVQRQFNERRVGLNRRILSAMKRENVE